MRAPLKWISLDMLDESKIKDIQLFRLTKTKTLSDKKKKSNRHRFETTQLKLWYVGY